MSRLFEEFFVVPAWSSCTSSSGLIFLVVGGREVVDPDEVTERLHEELLVVLVYERFGFCLVHKSY